LDSRTRAFIYAFLSRVFEKELDKKAIEDLKKNPELLEMIGPKTKEYFLAKSAQEIEDELNIDYSSLFLVNSQPVESLVIDAGGDILVGLQNPVMFFYFENGYEIDMNKTEILAPDHLSIEFGFMQNLAYRKEDRLAKRFLSEHLLQWVPPYLLGLAPYAKTSFYQEITDFTTEFLLTDYAFLKEVV